MKIKSWFLNQNFNENERYVVSVGDEAIERETEKAYLIKWVSDYGTLTRWVPKSCIMSDEEIASECKRIISGIEYNEKLVIFAKENNIKGVRIGLKTKTLIKKIQDAGFEVPDRA